MTNIRAVELSLNTANFNGSIDQSIRRLTAMGAELQALQARGGEYENSIEGLSQKHNILSRSVDASSIKLTEQRNRYDELVASGSASTEAIEQQAIAVNEALAEYNGLNTQLTEVSTQLDVQSSKWSQFQEIGGKVKSVGESISTISTPIKAIGVLAFNAAVDFENAFAGVRQSVNTSEENFKKLEDGIRSMAKELPVSATEIAGVVESAGQLGIAEDHLLSFSRTVIDLGASTSMTREQAATEFARFAGIVGMSQGDFDRLGSSVVELSNKMGVTESDIIAMGMGFAKQGAQLGMTEAQIMGLAGTMSSLGIQADTGGAAMTTVLQKIQKAVGDGGESLSGFAKAANMSSADFKKAFETDAVSALDALVKGLAESSEGGADLTSVLAELGVKGDETDVLLSMANASGLLSSAVDTSSQAWKDNTALSNEAAQNYKSTESQMTIMKNQLVDIGISIGQILIPMVLKVMDVIAPWIEKFSNLSSETQKTIVIIGGLAAAIGPLLVVGGTLISSVGSIISAVGGFSMAIGAAGGATTAFGAAFALISGPVGIAAGLLTGFGIAAYIVGRELNESSIQVTDWKDKVSESTAESVGSFLELSDQATVALNQMAWSGVAVTEEMAANMVGIYNEMGDQVLTEMQSDHAQELETMQNHFAQSDALTEEQEAKILERVAQSQAKQQLVITSGKARIEEIYQNASQNNREITEAEQQEINLIQQTMTENAIKHLSDSEVEQKVILESLKNEASKITAEQAAEVVRNSLKQKDDVLKEAEEQYNETKKWAVRQRDETGTMSAEEAQAVIDEAKKKRDETVANAEDMHQKVVSEAQLQAEEHVNKVDWETGEIKSRWKVYTENVASDAKALGKAISDGWNNAWTATKNRVSEIKQTAENKIHEMKTAIGNKMSEVKGKFESIWNEVQSFLSGVSLKNIGTDIVSGLIRGIGDMFGNVKGKIEELAGLIPDWARKVLGIKSPSRVFMDIGRNTIEGWEIGMAERKNNLNAVMNDLTNNLLDISNHYSKEEKKIADQTNAEIVQIEKQAKEDVDAVYRNAYAKKRKTTQEENNSIQRIQEEAAVKISEIEKKASVDSTLLIEKAQKDRLDGIKSFIQDKKSMEELSLIDEALLWEQSLDQFGLYSNERVEAQKAYQNAVQTINKEITAINTDYSNQIQKINEDLIKQEETLTKAYTDAVDKRAQSLYSFKNLFDEFKVEIDITGEQLLVNLGTQVEGFKVWQYEIEKLSEKAIDKGLLEDLRQMGPNALPQLIALNQLTDQQLSQYSKLYQEKSALARKQAETELISMKSDTDKQILELRDVANKQLDILQKEWVQKIKLLTVATAQELTSLHQVGVDAGQGLLDGLSSKEGALHSKAQSIANTIKNTIQKALDIHSPSRIMRGFGVNIGQGLVLGMDDMVGKVAGAAQRLASTMEENVALGSSSIDKSRTYSNGDTHIYVYGDNASPSEIARKHMQVQRQLAMEWGMT
ncbi:phage tail tape measure protein [Lysinibacillus fusiformis]|nr:phage tail tape measure protein [Lysinibacillus fusiformis]